MVDFNVPPCVGDEIGFVKQAIESHKICGDGAFTKKCHAWMEQKFNAQKVLLTTRKDNFYEQMDKSVKYLYCESRFKKKSFYDKVEVCSVQEFEQMISLFL